jgi:hypothetical protein
MALNFSQLIPQLQSRSPAKKASRKAKRKSRGTVDIISPQKKQKMQEFTVDMELIVVMAGVHSTQTSNIKQLV